MKGVNLCANNKYVHVITANGYFLRKVESDHHVIIVFEIYITLFFKKLLHQVGRLLIEDGKKITIKFYITCLLLTSHVE